MNQAIDPVEGRTYLASDAECARWRFTSGGVVFGSVTAFNPDRGWFETFVPEDDHGRRASYPRPDGDGIVMDRGKRMKVRAGRIVIERVHAGYEIRDRDTGAVVFAVPGPSARPYDWS